MSDVFAAPRFAPGLRHKGNRLGSLWYSPSEISGDATLSPDYQRMSPIEKADCLRDVLEILTEEYNSVLVELRGGGIEE